MILFNFKTIKFKPKYKDVALQMSVTSFDFKASYKIIIIIIKLNIIIKSQIQHVSSKNLVCIISRIANFYKKIILLKIDKVSKVLKYTRSVNPG